MAPIGPQDADWMVHSDAPARGRGNNEGMEALAERPTGQSRRGGGRHAQSRRRHVTTPQG